MIAEATVYKLLSSDDRLNALMDKIRGGAFGNGFKQGIFTYAIPENFNPRTREGCDAIRQGLRAKSPISIHAPAKGATGL